MDNINRTGGRSLHDGFNVASSNRSCANKAYKRPFSWNLCDGNIWSIALAYLWFSHRKHAHPNCQHFNNIHGLNNPRLQVKIQIRIFKNLDSL